MYQQFPSNSTTGRNKFLRQCSEGAFREVRPINISSVKTIPLPPNGHCSMSSLAG